MSNFPSVVPSGRVFTGGQIPTTAYKSMSGKETRILLSDKWIEHRLSLTFSNVLETGVQSIMDHWENRVGEYASFSLPSTVWRGWSKYTAAVSSSQKWRYESRPEVTAVSPGIMTVTVALVSVV